MTLLVLGVVTVVQSASRDTRPTSGVLVLGLVQKEDTKTQVLEIVAAPNWLSAAERADLIEKAKSLKAKGRLDEVTRIPRDGAEPVLLVGLGGEKSAKDPNTLRRSAAAASRALSDTAKATFCLPTPDPAAVQALTEGVVLGSYSFTNYKTKPETPAPLKTAVIMVTQNGQTKQAIARGEVVGDAVNFARDLVNTPPGELHPTELAKRAMAKLKSPALKLKLWNERDLQRDGFNAIIDVGKGSQHPPRLLRVEYRPKGAKAHLILVGKGITFDTGGYSIKPASGMLTMKADMAGAAAVVAATFAIATLKLKVNLTTYAALAENMVSAAAQRPSDVIKTYNGTTVEVLNTDAEGRLVLADALARALEDKPDVLVDIATLTGAASVALGKRTAGVMARDDKSRDFVVAAAKSAGEQIWGMPIPEEMRAGLDSDIADIANVGKALDASGGMLRGAAFLAEFVPASQTWAHIDIAGVAFNDGSPFGYTPTGGTGFGVRSLVALAESMQY